MDIDNLSIFLKKNNFVELNSINETVQFSKDTIKKFNDQLGKDKLYNSDIDLVIFGSIARFEMTDSSDVDWTMLVDGQIDSSIIEISHSIKSYFSDSKMAPPANSGLFGNITFGYDLVFYIGGEDDTNHNLTRRLLILLESISINQVKDGTAYDRVLKAILSEYIINDSTYKSDRGKTTKVPRFLLNDLIRFWRTMCVDFAYKQKEQKGKKWALRNIKLRMSRKLIFLKGLLMCYSCYKNSKLKNENEVISHLYELAKLRPLEIIIEVLKEEVSPDDLYRLLNDYDCFLKNLLDTEIRTHLEGIAMEDIYNDEVFFKMRKITDSFQDNINKIIHDKNYRSINEFFLKYGVF